MTKINLPIVFALLMLPFTISCTNKGKEIPVIPTDLTTALRAPAYPLVTVDPYFNAWSYTDNLYDDQPRHWTDKEFPLLGALRVDGEVYRFMGKENLPLKPVLPTAREEKWEGKYTFDQPAGDAWKNLTFNDASWATGKSAFGTPNEPNLSTLWRTKDIWVRRTFNLEEDLSGKAIYLHYSHDDIFELYINGIQVVETGYSWKYNVIAELSDEVKATLRKGENIITAHCHNRTGGGYVDFGLYEKEENKVSFDHTAEQKSVSVLPTQTVYTFDCGPVELDVVFTTPLLLEDLTLVSRPVSYLTYQVRSKDEASHEVQVYFEATPQWAVNNDSQAVGFEKIEKEGKTFLKTGTVEQPLLQKKGDNVRIDWGYFYMTGEGNDNAALNFGDYWNTKQAFQTNGGIAEAMPEVLSENIAKEMTVLAYSRDLGQVTSENKAGYIMLGYDDIYSIQYFEKNLKGYWTNDGTVDIFQAFKSAETDYASIMKRCDDFNRAMMADAEKAGGRKYAELVALAYRQAIAAHKLVKDENGTLLFLSKENNSNGSIGTVDITYPSSPLFLIYNPELVKGMMNHIFYYSESGKWTKPFAAHDVGTYPIANGQTYGGDMPIEESGNMLILAAAIAGMEGNADYAAQHWDVLTIWTDYLVEEGLDPDNQLCTDDFAGHFAHNANLSVKAIMGIASYGKLAFMLGKTDIAEKYLKIAGEMAVEWEKMARDGDHYKLTFDKADSWSQKYNLIWDRLLGFNIFDPEIARKEVAYYLTQQNEYGLPLDIRRTYTKSDWVLWTAVLTGERSDFEALVNPIYKYADETPSRVPVSDWHDTVTAERMNFKARSVVGGYFMKMLEQKLLEKSK
ncbi:glutaminase family protein [uncultured Proteiniphilum sp.]|uniref:glutaminase family protein n=1 Tax=uncultured Proteiniphilum sp. TaxID=497637 RepID=UPI00260B8452|nr:glutaminase family protein [uncultured Proteiniphilum sp.]